MRSEVKPDIFLAEAIANYEENVPFENWKSEVKSGVNTEILKKLFSLNLPDINYYICCAELYKIKKEEYSDFKKFEIVAKFYISPDSLSQKDIEVLSPEDILKIIELADKKILLRFKNIIENCELDKISKQDELLELIPRFVKKKKENETKKDEFDKLNKEIQFYESTKTELPTGDTESANKGELNRIDIENIDFDRELYEKVKSSIDKIDINSKNYRESVDDAQKLYVSFKINQKEGSNAKLLQKQSLFPNYIKLRIGELKAKIDELNDEIENLEKFKKDCIFKLFMFDYIIRFKGIIENRLKDYDQIRQANKDKAFSLVRELSSSQNRQETERKYIWGIEISELDAITRIEEWSNILDKNGNVSDEEYPNMICDLLLASRGKARESLLSIIKSTLHDESIRFNIEEIIGNLSSRQSEIGDEPELLLRDLSMYVFDQYRALEKDLKRAKRELQDTSGNIFRYLGEPMEKIEEFTFNISGSRQSSTVSELNNIVELFRKGFSKLKVESAVAFTDWKNRKTVEFSPELHMGDFEESTPVVPKTMGFAFDSSYSANSRKIIPAKVVSLSNIDVKEGTE